MVFGSLLVADGAGIDGACVALEADGLDVVGCGDGWSDGVGAAVAGCAHDAVVSVGFLVEFVGFLVAKVGSHLAMAGGAFGLVDPGCAIGLADVGHGAVAVDTEDLLGEMDVALAVGFEAGMAGIALVREVDLIKPFRVRGVHGTGHGGDAGEAGGVECGIGVAACAEDGFLEFERCSVLLIVTTEDVGGVTRCRGCCGRDCN